MIQITMDVRINFEANLTALNDAIEKGLRQLTMQAHQEWQDEAARRLKTTRRRYQDSLQYTIESSNTASITLQSADPSTQWLVNALEQGVDSFDMKPSRLGYAPSRSGGKPAFFWSSLHQTLPGKRKEPGQPFYQPTPFVDIPFRGGGAKEGRPTSYRRMHIGSQGFIHPGFKPLGKGGPGPLRPAVVEYIRKTAPEVFGPLIRATI